MPEEEPGTCTEANMPRKSKNQLNLEQQLARLDDREPEQRIVENVVQLTPTQKGGFTVQVLPNGLDVIKRMARNGQSKASIASSLGISLDKFKEALRAQPEVQEALTVGLAGLEDELANILLEHARGQRGDKKTSLIAAIYLSKARCGWEEGSRQHEQRPNVNIINLPDSKTPEEWMRAITAHTTKGELPQ